MVLQATLFLDLLRRRKKFSSGGGAVLSENLQTSSTTE
jgi:hypothetical protein